ncbi:MAG TPA: glycosyltransferase family 4 protein [Bacteroidales bacterium]|jgi:glycosyltransferase involved in cell wall biosynthesis|nr:glycosyltransferase family 4 protein [Bacteroidales bacterium]HQK69225.1 glycosyltransferase family 4 protein [Bacteroidales bacterium]
MIKRDAIIIFGDTFTFPEGNAATNRVYTFAKGFHENGIEVFVICFRNDYVETVEDTINEIHYYHPFYQTRRSRSFIKRRLFKFNKYFRTFRIIRSVNKNHKILAINLWTNRLLIQNYVFLLSRVFRTIVIHEHSEHPLRAFQKNIIEKMWGECKSFIGTRLCDGIFCISQYLIDFYKNRSVKEEKMILIPSTVDTERFTGVGVSPLPYNYIAYCGSLTIGKDGVDILIDSFSRLAFERTDIDLVLIGKGDSEFEEAAIKRQTVQLNLANRVHFVGQLSRTDVPAYLVGAKVLVLARPTSIVADAGFPSKLTEYLSTGKPVLVTRVGDIPLYLKDRENAFLSDPDSAEAFAIELRYILNNYEFALEVGGNGKRLTETIFNYNYQAKRMLEFIRKLKAGPYEANRIES